MGEAVAPDGRCIPIPLVLCLFQLVRGGTNVMYAVGLGKESLPGSLFTSSMVHVEGMFSLEKRDEEIGELYSYTCRGITSVGRCWVTEIVGWFDSRWLSTPS